MSRGSVWHRTGGQLTLSGAADADQVILDLPAEVEGITLVRMIITLTWEVSPNEFTGSVTVWAGSFVTAQDDLDPRFPNAHIRGDWSFWDFRTVVPPQQFGPSTADHRFGPTAVTDRFDVRGARIIHRVSELERHRFYASQETSGDPAGAISCFFGVAALYLLPTVG